MLQIQEPQALDNELEILSILISQVNLIDIVRSLGLKPDHFYHSYHATIYEALLHLRDTHARSSEDNFKVFPLLLTDIAQSEKLEQVGGRDYLIDLGTKIIYSENLEACVNGVLFEWQKREVIRIAQKLEQNMRSPIDKQGFLENIKKFTDQVQEVLENKSDEQILRPMADYVIDVTSKIDEQVDIYEGKKTLDLKISTYTDIDKKIGGGLPKGQLSIVAGRAGMGKTTVGVHIAASNALAGLRVGYFSLEMDSYDMFKKFCLASNGPQNIAHPTLSAKDIFQAGMSSETAQILAGEVFNWAANETLRLSEATRIKVQDVHTALLQAQMRNEPLDLVVIDYIALLTLDQGDRRLQLSYAIQELRKLAKEFNVAILGLAQIRRLDNRGDKRPTIDDIKETGAYEEEASILIGLYRDSYYNKEAEDDGIIELSLLKNRFGVMGPNEVTSALFDPDHCRLLRKASSF